MSDVTYTLHETIIKFLFPGNFEVIGVIPLLNPKDKALSLNAFWESFSKYEQDKQDDTLEYLVRIKPKKRSFKLGEREKLTHQKPAFGEIYLRNGKLNVPFLIKNADLLFDAADYSLARKIYKTILHSGEYTATILHRLGKCYEAEGKLDEACLRYEESIAFHPTLESYRRLAAVLVRQNKEQQAEEVLQRAFALKELMGSEGESQTGDRLVVRALGSKLRLNS